MCHFIGVPYQECLSDAEPSPGGGEVRVRHFDGDAGRHVVQPAVASLVAAVLLRRQHAAAHPAPSRSLLVRSADMPRDNGLPVSDYFRYGFGLFFELIRPYKIFIRIGGKLWRKKIALFFDV